MEEETDQFELKELEESNEGNMILEEKEFISENEDIKTFKEDDQDQAHYTINNKQPNDKSIDEPFPVLEEGTPYYSFVFSLIVGHYILFDKRKNNGPDDIISLYYKGPEFKKIKTSSTNKENNHKKKKIKGKIFEITKEKEDDIKKERKSKDDMIRKKILGKFRNEILIQIQELYQEENVKVKKWFRFDKKFRENTSIEKNKNILDYTLGKYLDEHCFDKNKEKFNEFKLNNGLFSRKMKDLYNEYLDSRQFEESIKKLVEKGESFDYISQYINVAKKVIDYYEKSLCREIKNKIAKEQ